jgi:integrase
MTPKGWLLRPAGRNSTLYLYKNSLGKTRSRTLGSATLSDADAWKIVGQKGYDLLAGSPDPTGITFGKLKKLFLLDGRTKAGRPKSKGTRTTEARNCRIHLSDFDDQLAVDITPKQIKDWLGDQSEGLRDKLHWLMSSIYRLGRVDGHIPPTCDPLKDISTSALTDFEAIILSPEETFTLLKEINDPLVWTLVVVLAVTALRVSEALGLRWSDLDFKKGKIKVQRGFTSGGGIDKPKSRASRSTVEMHEALQAVMMDWRAQTIYGKEGDYIFPSYQLKGEKPRVGSMIVADYIRPAAEKLGYRPADCPRFGFQNLRHSLATWLVDSGVEPVVVVRMLRQTEVKMAMHYSHLDKKARKAQGDFMGVFLKDGRVQ